ncbi:hypothetical protein THASP1DRAFT_33865 [Thamnocephalis sphaerospora]|uniref:Uncharacterized protein n=1 Tax=Thamnocephalis sphaerospora TaxID=78915 RepID=A0A4P9XFP8_9FUNG|nr:hypothetical protein THASP1DRAFT_33865 [Thamnocephalis sphaerospora]|eukprot:RKP04378.1 hypothetical protein THASP1DRAFT_33865 [Thamnocephalis sphaerospora]
MLNNKTSRASLKSDAKHGAECSRQRRENTFDTAADESKRSPETSAMEGIVGRLMAPQVPANEEREYGRYVDQFRTAFKSLKPVPRGGLVQDPAVIKHPEYRTYASYVARSQMHPSELRTALTDEQVYRAYARLPGANRQWCSASKCSCVRDRRQPVVGVGNCKAVSDIRRTDRSRQPGRPK